jgi:hypothetical protein
MGRGIVYDNKKCKHRLGQLYFNRYLINFNLTIKQRHYRGKKDSSKQYNLQECGKIILGE